MKARALKEVWNVAAAVPVPVPVPVQIERGASLGNGNNSGSYCEELVPEENFLAACNQEMLARGGELLKRTRKGIINVHNSTNFTLKTHNACLDSQGTFTGKLSPYTFIEVGM